MKNYLKKLYYKWLWRRANVPEPRIFIALIERILKQKKIKENVILKVNKNGTIDLMFRKQIK